MSFEKRNFGEFLINIFPNINEEDIIEALKEQLNSSFEIRKTVGEILVKKNKLTDQDRDEALKEYEKGFKED